jgi:hypothetical protein
MQIGGDVMRWLIFPDFEIAKASQHFERVATVGLRSEQTNAFAPASGRRARRRYARRARSMR